MTDTPRTDEAEFDIYDGDDYFAGVSGQRERVWGEAMHYAMQCEKPRIEEVTRTPAPMGEEPPLSQIHAISDASSKLQGAEIALANRAIEANEWRKLGEKITGMEGMKPRDLMEAIADNVQEWRDEAAEKTAYAAAAFRAIGKAGCDLYDALNGAKSTDEVLKLVRAAQVKLDALPEYEIGTGNPKPVGRCATTQTERYRVEGCTCPTYPGNEGLPCLTWCQSRAADRCAYCDHNLECHRRLSAMFKGSHAVGHLNATDTAAILKGARAALIRYGAPAGEPYLEVLDLAVQRCHSQVSKQGGDRG